GAQRALGQNEIRQHGQPRLTSPALETPDSYPTQVHAEIMGVARQASATATGGLVFELKGGGQEEGEHAFDKGLAIAQELNVGRFVLKIDSDGAVFSWSSGCVAHVLPPGHRVC